MTVAGPVTIVLAGKANAENFVQVWVPYDLWMKFTNPGWTYRQFPWPKILVISGWETFAAVDGKQTEGMIAIERVRNATHLKVHRLSTAPWNFGPQKQRSGIGSGLLAYAVELCRRGGFAGLELSSTPESETFYTHLGWRKTGARDVEGLSIFQLAADSIDGFLAKYQPFPELPTLPI